MTKRITRGYKTNKGNILTGDDGIDLVGEHRGVKFVVQYKNFTHNKVNSSLVRDFIGGLLKYTPDTLGIFVAPSGYTQSSLEVKKRSSDDCDTITIENAEVDNIEVEEGSTLSLFGIEVKGKVSLSNIKFKNITIKKRKLEDN
ncbi:hypothetical protein RhiirA5_428073 [Rhizophagus irregularis]|uniref:Restriction endonuclease type IV Mrr domain-containing protein n=1 Tax=Rhizophagus irregularis TaxID=588596 RepID=A0A2N0P124_9GLOM|nr:hypothetical protein RhiirA5_428073 [Rhizophagus irregularis]